MATSKRLAKAVTSEFERLALDEMKAAVRNRDLTFGIEQAKENAAERVMKRVGDLLVELVSGKEDKLTSSG